MIKKFVAEYLGTLWLIVAGCGSAIISASSYNINIGPVGVALAFGLGIMTMVYTIGPISGCHLNPAVSIGLTIAGRFEPKLLLPYIGSQLLGAISGAGILYLIVLGKPDPIIGNFAANGYNDLSPNRYELSSAFLTELIMTFFFVCIILGSTYHSFLKGFQGIAIGLGLTLIHLISIPITNASVNPARSTSQALFADTAALDQLWLFWVAPIMGAVIAGIVFRLFTLEVSIEEQK